MAKDKLLSAVIEPQDAPSKSLVTEQLAIHDELKAERDTRFMVDWQLISSYTYPNQSDINVSKTESISAWTQNIYDTTTLASAQILAAGMGNWWTPPNQPWAEYGPPEELKKESEDDSDQEDEVPQWLGKASDAAMRELGRSNFYSVKGECDNAFAAFATDVIIFDESDTGNELFNFVPCKIGTYTIEENYKGIVDTLRHEIKLTFRQIKQKFAKGSDNIPAKMVEHAKKDPKRKFVILHCIFPRQDSERLPKAKDGANMPFASVYIAMEYKEVIRVSGYHENPILARRFAKWGTGAVWGFGPSYLALPDARQVNYVSQYMDAAAEKLVDPPVLTPDSLDGDVDLRAGGRTVFDSSNPNALPQTWNNTTEYKLGMELMANRQQQIRDAFFVDAFKLLNSQPLIDKEMTAYEISQRQAEQLQGITPAFTRTITEFINPLMQRVFGIMFRANKLKNPPQALLQPNADGKSASLVMPEVVVTSRFNDALRALKNRGAEQSMAFLLPQLEIKPENADVFDWDKMNREYAMNAGIAPDSLSTAKQMKQVRQARAQMMQAQRQAELANSLADTAQKVGGAPDWAQSQLKQQVGA